MNVDFWFDPACPFCWATSKWLVKVAPERDLDIEWRSISLLFKNQPPEDSEYYAPTRWTSDLLRVTEAMRAAGHADRIGEAYSLMTDRIHVKGELFFDAAEIIQELGLDPELAEAAKDESWDQVIKDAMNEGLALVGEDVGTPIIAVPGDDGPVALFGPVLTVVPDLDESLEIWDAFMTFVNNPNFFELKRTRTASPKPADVC